MMVAFPFLLLWFVGLRGPAVLYGGRWSDLSPFWMAYLGLCGLGLLGLTWSMIRWRLRSTPAVQISNDSRTVNIAERLGYKPLGKGGYGFLASLPGNEALKVQVSDKRYALSRVPEEWHELSILHLADTHFIGNLDRPFFEEIARLGAEMRPDLIVFTGDLLDDMELLPWLAETFGRLQAPLGCYYVLGNHDWFYGAAEIREEFARCGWQGVGGRSISVEHRGHRLEIAGTERPWMGAHPEFSGEPGDFRLLLSHTPDQFPWARAHGVDLMLAGHNHGGQVVLPLIGPVFAPSRFGVRYAAGAFWADPTLLYVSRGLSGRHPLRLNCPPELTRIVLESPGRRTTDGA
jgi:predicted MPP superfamily phosphohydrolase